MLIPDILYEKIAEWVFNNTPVIFLNKAEIQSGSNRVKYAEGLIRQLPENHEGRNTWLLNYGSSMEAKGIRSEKAATDPRIVWDEHTQSLKPVGGETPPTLETNDFLLTGGNKPQ